MTVEGSATYERLKDLEGAELLRVRGTRERWTSYANGFVLCSLIHGVADIRYRGKSAITVHPDSVMMMQPGDVHRGICSARSDYDVLFVEEDTVASVLGDMNGAKNATLTTFYTRDTMLKQRFTSLAYAFGRTTDPADRQSALNALVACLLERCAKGSESRYRRREPRLVASVREQIHDNLAGRLDLHAIAASLGVGKHHLIRTFSQHVGMPPYMYLMHVRVAHARHLLAAGFGLFSVADQLGYFDQSLLNRHFKRIVGVTPGAYARTVRH